MSNKKTRLSHRGRSKENVKGVTRRQLLKAGLAAGTGFLHFDIPGRYVWHCHIVEHEDNEMMRPYHVGPIPLDNPVGPAAIAGAAAEFKKK